MSSSNYRLILRGLGALCLWAAAALQVHADDRLVVHEWGTFTSLQDESGFNLTAINSDDEPVPPFVHRLTPGLVVGRTDMPFNKGIPSHLPDVTMRLETPVIYFHPPVSRPVQKISVRVQFRGGWLTEFYPKAAFRAPGFTPGPDAGRISRDTVGELTWENLQLGLPALFPKTNAAVWLAPRAVQAASVRAPNGEAERYLFYRGVGNVQPPVRVMRDGAARTLQVCDERDLPIRAAWLVSIRRDGRIAFQATGALTTRGLRATLPSEFGEEQHSAANLPALRASMKTALVADGLFADEADALLNTWRISYFKSPGLRFFYLCPRPEIDAILPLQLSEPAKIERVMVGRIELVTPEQREGVRTISRGPVSRERSGVVTPTAQKAGPVPEEQREMYVAYERLGRFRNALLLRELAQNPTEPLRAFLQQVRVIRAPKPAPTVAAGAR